MSGKTGLDAALYLRAATGNVPTTLVGTLFECVSDVGWDSAKGLADVSCRANGGWRSQVVTLKDLTVNVSLPYKGASDSNDVLRDAFIGNTQVDVAVLSDSEGAYEGFVARFEVTNWNGAQPLEGSQTIDYTLTLSEFGAVLEGTHGVT